MSIDMIVLDGEEDKFEIKSTEHKLMLNLSETW